MAAEDGPRGGEDEQSCQGRLPAPGSAVASYPVRACDSLLLPPL